MGSELGRVRNGSIWGEDKVRMESGIGQNRGRGTSEKGQDGVRNGFNSLWRFNIVYTYE